MACYYNLTINGLTSGPGSVTEPIKLGSVMDSTQQYSKEMLIRDLMQLQKTGQIKSLVESVKKAMDAREILDAPLKIKEANKYTAIQTLASHLRGLGVDVEVLSRAKMNEKFGIDADALTEDGKIYVCEDSDITAPMHEMLHLVFGVMKAQNYDQYEKFMKLIQKTKPFQQVFQEISNNSEYANMMRNDRLEEAVIRLYEQLLNEERNVNNLQIDNLNSEKDSNVFDRLNNMLIPYIQSTFGIEEVTSVIRFFQDSISELPVNGSTLFIRPKISTTGYTEHIQKITMYGKVANLIKELATPKELGGRGEITQEGCK